MGLETRDNHKKMATCLVHKVFAEVYFVSYEDKGHVGHVFGNWG